MSRSRSNTGWSDASPGGRPYSGQRPVDSIPVVYAAAARLPGCVEATRQSQSRRARSNGRAATDGSQRGYAILGPWFDRADAAERRLCLRLNRSVASVATRKFFAVVSQLGDGVFWYGLLAALPLAYGRAGLRASAQMGVAALLGVVIYLVLKTRLVRERPYITHLDIEAHVAPLDRYSFPSGHTLHAVCFTLLAVSHFPWLAILLAPVALLIAASRVILGLHYPSDVLAGAVIGAALAGPVHAITPS